MNAVISIPFHERAITLIDHDGKPFVAMRPIVDGMGLNWKGQQTKLQNRFASTVAIIHTVAEDGRKREMLCLPLEKIPAWLLTINPKKVNPAAREAVEQYQAESEAVLWTYWTTGQARRNDIRREMAELEQEENASFQRGSDAGRDLNIRKLEKQRNQAMLNALQAQLPFVWEGLQ